MLLLTFLIIAFATYFAIPRIQTRVAGITDPADSAHFRLVSWSNTLSIIQDNLLLGVGFNTFRYAQKEYGLVDYSGYESHGASGSDSSLLFVLATTGIFGLMFFLGGFMQPLFKSKNLLLKTLIVSLLLESFFINSLFYPQILIIWIVLLINYSTFDI
jgi:O-antigen ligase